MALQRIPVIWKINCILVLLLTVFLRWNLAWKWSHWTVDAVYGNRFVYWFIVSTYYKSNILDRMLTYTYLYLRRFWILYKGLIMEVPSSKKMKLDGQGQTLSPSSSSSALMSESQPQSQLDGDGTTILNAANSSMGLLQGVEDKVGFHLLSVSWKLSDIGYLEIKSLKYQ